MCSENKGLEILAVCEGMGSVGLCGCGTVSLHVQAMTLRMELRAFHQATAMMQEALAVLEQKAMTLAALELRAGSPMLH